MNDHPSSAASAAGSQVSRLVFPSNPLIAADSVEEFDLLELSDTINRVNDVLGLIDLLQLERVAGDPEAQDGIAWVFRAARDALEFSRKAAAAFYLDGASQADTPPSSAKAVCRCGQPRCRRCKEIDRQAHEGGAL